MARDAAIAIDIGGTFTDVTLFDRASGRMWNAKTPSTPHDPSVGFVDGMDAALRVAGLTADAVGQVIHGTTVATNMILEGKGADCALLTTRGFKHVLEIGRHDIPRKSNMYSWVKPKRPVKPQHILEIAGRIDHTGDELEPLDEAGVRAAARSLRDAGIEAIAISFIHAYANPAHERRTRELILAEHPGAMVALSAEVLPVFREYERSMTTILNVYVMPRVASYVAKLEERLAERGIAAPLLLMKSSGGGPRGPGGRPPYLLEGGLTLDRAGSIAAIQARIAEPLGLDVSAAARGILAVVDNNMVGAIRVVSVERGYDPRDFALVPFGGAGPLHGGALARLLAIKTIVVPPAPGVLSALGLLVSNTKADYSRTFLHRPPHYDLPGIAAVFQELESEAVHWLEREGAAPENRTILRQASMRYHHQGFELTVPSPSGATDAPPLK